MVTELGVTFGQGYLLGRPAQAETWLQIGGKLQPPNAARPTLRVERRASVRSTWRAGIDGRSGKAIGLGIEGGIAAIIGAGCFAAAIILFLLSQGPTG